MTQKTQMLGGCCTPLSDGTLNETDAVALADALKVLADPARLRLLSLIASAPEGEACACDLVTPLGRSQPTISHHLSMLVDGTAAPFNLVVRVFEDTLHVKLGDPTDVKRRVLERKKDRTKFTEALLYSLNKEE